GATGSRPRNLPGLACPASCLLRRHHPCDRFDEPVPATLLGGKLLAPRGRERVEARAAVVLRRAPRALDPVAVLEALQRRVERSVIDQQRRPRACLNGERDAVAVMGPQREDAENEQVERALQQVGAGGFGRHSTRLWSVW